VSMACFTVSGKLWENFAIVDKYSISGKHKKSQNLM